MSKIRQEAEIWARYERLLKKKVNICNNNEKQRPKHLKHLKEKPRKKEHTTLPGAAYSYYILIAWSKRNKQERKIVWIGNTKPETMQIILRQKERSKKQNCDEKTDIPLVCLSRKKHL